MWNMLKSAFLIGWHGLGEVLIGMVYIWPLLLVVLVAIVVKRFAAKKEKASVNRRL